MTQVIWLALLAVLATVFFSPVHSFDATKNYRCKCVCPQGLNQTLQSTVFIAGESDPRECKCFNIVPDATIEFCLRCRCQIESFNGVLMKAIVFLILTFFAVLILVLIWQCSSELYAKRQARLSVSAYDVIRPADRFSERPMSPVSEDSDDEVGFTLQGRDPIPIHTARPNTPFQRTVRRIQTTVAASQQELQRQQNYVYDRHALLS